MGIYLNEAGAHTKYINKKYNEFKQHQGRNNAFSRIAHNAADAGAQNGYTNRMAQELQQYHADKEDEIREDIAKGGNSVYYTQKYANKHPKNYGGDWDNATRDNIRRVKKNLGVGKDNIPKNRKPNAYLKAQNMINIAKKEAVKEACEYILSVLDED